MLLYVGKYLKVENIGEFGEFMAIHQILTIQKVMVDKIHKSPKFYPPTIGIFIDYKHGWNTEVFLLYK